MIFAKSSIISTHTPLAGCDGGRSCHRILRRHFNSHTPRGVRRRRFVRCRGISLNFNSHTPRGVRPDSRACRSACVVISTHTPLAGCDCDIHSLTLLISHFNSHTPRGVRLTGISSTRSPLAFQLTHPSRGATRRSRAAARTATFQLTHPSRGATRRSMYGKHLSANFNSHTPRGVRRRSAQ